MQESRFGQTGGVMLRIKQRISTAVLSRCAVSLYAASAHFLGKHGLLFGSGMKSSAGMERNGSRLVMLPFGIFGYDMCRDAVRAGFMWLWGNTAILAPYFGLMVVQAAVVAGLVHAVQP